MDTDEAATYEKIYTTFKWSSWQVCIISENLGDAIKSPCIIWKFNNNKKSICKIACTHTLFFNGFEPLK